MFKARLVGIEKHQKELEVKKCGKRKRNGKRKKRKNGKKKNGKKKL